MDSWQEEIVKKLRDFVGDYPPSKMGDVEVKMYINSKEAYVLLNIAEQWAKSNLPTIFIEPGTDATNKTTDRSV